MKHKHCFCCFSCLWDPLGCQEIRKTTQEDIDKAYMRTHTNLEDGALAQNQHNSAEMLKYLARSGDAHSLDTSAFDGQLARLGGISQLSQDVEAAVEEHAEEAAAEEAADEAEQEEAARKTILRPVSCDLCHEAHSLPPP